MNATAQPASTSATVDALFVGDVGILANDGAASAMHKRAVDEARWLDADGVAGDSVGDPIHHGGRDRALNHYPAEHYALWRSRYPGYDDIFVPGVLGENISTTGVTEDDVCVGDIFQLGEATIQIAQPRQPCWKIGACTGIGGLATAVIKDGKAGWLYRVIEPGCIGAGDRLTRIEPATHGITIARLWTLFMLRRPNAADRGQMWTLTELGALAPEWRKRMAQRARGNRR